ncbi:MAG: aminopeptidase [Firmicutes bacterium]|nr:aminopeptidase [[Eubacterium] siraeum]MCM1488026.1 aminopeptidase [Bacillota bacterium]
MATAKKGESKAKELQEKLFMKKKNSGLIMTDAEMKAADKFNEGYKSFLDSAKTEREAVKSAVAIAKKAGYTEFQTGKKYKAGDKVYYNNRGKAVILAIFGKESIEKGVNILAAHIDSPRLDLKQNPLYEDAEMAYFKTHYYGGIKKYQWAAIPLALHGVIIKKDGGIVDVKIGEDDKDPVFVVTDLLPHLAQDQMKRPAPNIITGEELNILIGSRPFKDDKVSELVKLNIMNILFEKYGIVEEDFLSAELEVVPAFKARDIGFDRSMIGAYGQDDRVCGYTALMATVDTKGIPSKTVVTVLTDKEETGSEGNTGLQSSYLEYFIHDIAECFGKNGRHVLSASKCLSADVNAGFDPTFPDPLEKKNCAYVGKGTCLTKFTGARGKSDTNDASAEFVGYVRKIFDDNKIIWQTGELGKVDFGGGGTVAKYISNLDVDTIDLGVPVLSMHAPFEITSKNDVYMTYKAFAAFIK